MQLCHLAVGLRVYVCYKSFCDVETIIKLLVQNVVSDRSVPTQSLFLIPEVGMLLYSLFLLTQFSKYLQSEDLNIIRFTIFSVFFFLISRLIFRTFRKMLTSRQILRDEEFLFVFHLEGLRDVSIPEAMVMAHLIWI